MFQGRSTEPLTKEFILSRISEEDIFVKYMNIHPNTYDYFKNPLRADNHADCRFYRDGRGVLKFKDFAYNLNIDCFNLVMMVFPDHNNYGLALRKIAEDFKLYEKDVDYSVLSNWENNIKDASKKFSIIAVKRKEFTKDELLWWQEQGIYKEVLSHYKVSSLQMLWLNGNLIYNFNKKDPGYVYHFNLYNYKAYFPLRKEYRFIQNIDRNTLQGYEQLPKEGTFLVITKSMKDVLCMYSFDIPSIAPSSETVLINEKDFSELANRFFYIFTLFDRDRAGMHMSWIMRKKYNTIPLLFESKGLMRRKEEPKDFTDNYKEFGTSYLQDLIEEVKANYL